MVSEARAANLFEQTDLPTRAVLIFARQKYVVANLSLKFGEMVSLMISIALGVSAKVCVVFLLRMVSPAPKPPQGFHEIHSDELLYHELFWPLKSVTWG